MTVLYQLVFTISFLSLLNQCHLERGTNSILIDRIREQIHAKADWNDDGSNYPVIGTSDCQLTTPGERFLCDPDSLVSPGQLRILQGQIESTLSKSSCGCQRRTSFNCNRKLNRYLPMVALAENITYNGSIDNFSRALLRKFNIYTSVTCRNRDRFPDNVILLVIVRQTKQFSMQMGAKARDRVNKKCSNKIRDAMRNDLRDGKFFDALEIGLKYTDSIARCDQCNEKCKLTVGVIIGIVFGVIGFIVIVLGTIICCIGFFQNWDCVVGTCIGVCIGMLLGCIQACINAIIASIIASMCEACGCDDCCSCEPFECVDEDGQPSGFSGGY